MVFILSTDGRDLDVIGQFEKYNAYLKSRKDVFPASAYAMATSDWYFDPNDHRSPHDYWLFDARIIGGLAGVSKTKIKTTLQLKLLGAYHDGYIDIVYSNVHEYAFQFREAADGHHEWRYDELRLSERGHLIHEIEWSGADSTGSWVIEADDLEFTWTPIAPAVLPSL